MSHWATRAVFYHIYPLGLCGAPAYNDFNAPPLTRLERIHAWLDHIQGLGATALYLGPLFESTAHGYDTADYYHVDRRLGTRSTLANLVADCHNRGMYVILDGVFNHTGRHFWAFRDVQARGQGSPYVDWFYNLQFGRTSPYNDPFSYEGWNGHYDLVKLNLHNPAVKEHLFGAVEMWVHELGIDGLRLDTADCLDLSFLKELSRFCRGLRSDFWLIGEVIHGDYRRWANPETLDSVTNYECYKGLYSSHVDKNYFELSYAFNRQFGEGGLYRGLPLYAFADNHDVDRVASRLTDPAHLYPLYYLLFGMPGVPSVYYGSEWGLPGCKEAGSDAALRPALDLASAALTAPHPELAATIGRLAHLRRSSPALLHGDYRGLFTGHEQMAFLRSTNGQRAVVAVNAAAESATLDLLIPGSAGVWFEDRLNGGGRYEVHNGRLQVTIPPRWGRILIEG